MSANTELRRLCIRFDDLPLTEASKAAKELGRVLTPSVGPNGSVDFARTDSTRQDMGTVLVLLLSAPSAVAIAKGIHDYIAKRGSRVVIETPEGTVLATGDAASNIDIAKTAAAIRNS